MKKSEFENFLGRNVEVTVKGKRNNKYFVRGVLHKTGEDHFKNNPNLYLPHNFYFCINKNGEVDKFLFRSSHVLTVKEI